MRRDPNTDVSDNADVGEDVFDAGRLAVERTGVEPIRPWPDLAAQQAVLEIAMDARGAKRALKADAAAAARGDAARTMMGKELVAGAIDATADAIRAHLAAHPAAAPGAREAAATRLDGLDPEAVAMLTLRVVAAAFVKPQSLTKLANQLGALVEDEARAASVRGVDQKIRSDLRAALRRAARLTQRRRLLGAAAGAAAEAAGRDAPAAWTLRDRHFVGVRLLDLVIRATGVVEIFDDARGARTVKVVAPTLRGALAAERAVAIATHVRPLYEPMVVPPKAWSSVACGGYQTTHARPLRLLKSAAPEQADALTPARAAAAFDAANVAQETAWRVNDRVLDVFIALREGGLGPDADADALAAAGVASNERVEAPPAPEPDADPERARLAAAARADWASSERARASRRLAQDACVATAQRFRLFERIFFPVQYDFRGRMYAATHFSPQGPDAMRGLLHFADAEPVGEDGLFWLAVHVCNCGDFEKMSKAPLRDRVDWTIDNSERIATVAADPLADLWWSEADKPFQFLAACFEWADALAHGEDHRSRLPIALDGSCSGLQHFSLALRDEVCGDAVNLAPAAASADIYMRVADAVRALLERDASSEATFACGKAPDGTPRREPVAKLARQWRAFGVDRSLVKRPTMTYGYGARAYGYTEQILEDTLRPAYARIRRSLGPGDASDEALIAAGWPFDGRGFVAALYMGGRIIEAVEQVVLRAADAMRWLQDAASIAAEEEAPLAWTAPDGFPVVQAYPRLDHRRVKTAIAGEIVKLSLREESDALDRRRQRQGAAPNFVHSLDACHLRMAVLRAAGEGFDAFQLIHDSFGAHASRTGRFFEILRETLVEMYGAIDVLTAFHDDVAGRLSEAGRARLGPPPEKGALRIGGVLESEFCFA